MSDKAKIIYEDILKLNEVTKQFVFSDGNMLTAVYPKKINYKCGNSYQKIDNTMVFDNKGFFKNKRNPLKVKMFSSTYCDGMARIEKDNFAVSWTYSRNILSMCIPKIKKASGLKNNTTFHVCQDKMVSEIMYKDIEENMDIEYKIDGLNLKEKIILKNNMCNKRFKFLIKVENLNVTKNKNGEIEFKDINENTIFLIPRGTVTDVLKDTKCEVSYEIEKEGEDIIICVIPEERWVWSEKRVYPLAVDTIIISDIEGSKIQSAYFKSDN